MYLAKQELLKFEPHMIADYCYIAGRCMSKNDPYPLPHIHTLVMESQMSINQEHLSRLLSEAIENGMHEHYGMNKREFMRRAQSMEIRYFDENKIPINEVMDSVIKFVHQRRMSHMDYNDELINSPIGKGIW